MTAFDALINFLSVPIREVGIAMSDHIRQALPLDLRSDEQVQTVLVNLVTRVIREEGDELGFFLQISRLIVCWFC